MLEPCEVKISRRVLRGEGSRKAAALPGDEAEFCDRVALIYRGELIAEGTPESLKTKCMSDHVLEVVCDRPQEAMAEIEKLSGIKEAALFGREIHVMVEKAESASAAVRNLLNKQGFRLYSLEKIIPSLEDVFVSLIEAHDRAEQPQSEVRQ